MPHALESAELLISIMKFSNKLRISLALLLGSLCSAANPDKLSPDLFSKQQTGDVIVQYKHPPTEEVQRRAQFRGARLRTRLDQIQSAVYTMSAAAAADLSDDDEVLYISPDRSVQALLDYAEPTVNANMAFANGYDGTGVTVAVIDSGINGDKDLQNAAGQSRVTKSFTYVPGMYKTSDAYGHGTHVAGILAGNAAQSSGPNAKATFRGIAPNASIVNIRVLDANGASTDSVVIQGINQAIALKVNVINLSLGRPAFESYTLDPLCQAVERAWKAGIVVVVAAGNQGRNQATQGYATITAPGNDPYVITVGAMKDRSTLTRTDDLIASYSSKGPTFIDHVVKPDLVAPGNRIASLSATSTILWSNSSLTTNLIDQSYYLVNATGTSTAYYRLSGTSMASPMVSGAAALLLQKTPGLSPDSI